MPRKMWSATLCEAAKTNYFWTATVKIPLPTPWDGAITPSAVQWTRQISQDILRELWHQIFLRYTLGLGLLLSSMPSNSATSSTAILLPRRTHARQEYRGLRPASRKFDRPSTQQRKHWRQKRGQRVWQIRYKIRMYNGSNRRIRIMNFTSTCWTINIENF